MNELPIIVIANFIYILIVVLVIVAFNYYFDKKAKVDAETEIIKMEILLENMGCDIDSLKKNLNSVKYRKRYEILCRKNKIRDRKYTTIKRSLFSFIKHKIASWIFCYLIKVVRISFKTN